MPSITEPTGKFPTQPTLPPTAHASLSPETLECRNDAWHHTRLDGQRHHLSTRSCLTWWTTMNITQVATGLPVRRAGKINMPTCAGWMLHDVLHQLKQIERNDFEFAATPHGVPPTAQALHVMSTTNPRGARTSVAEALMQSGSGRWKALRAESYRGHRPSCNRD